MSWQDDSDTTMPCPYCGQEMYDDAVRCPQCGNYLSEEDAPSHKPTWILFLALGCLAVVVLSWVLQLW